MRVADGVRDVGLVAEAASEDADTAGAVTSDEYKCASVLVTELQ